LDCIGLANIIFTISVALVTSKKTKKQKCFPVQKCIIYLKDCRSFERLHKRRCERLAYTSSKGGDGAPVKYLHHLIKCVTVLIQ